MVTATNKIINNAQNISCRDELFKSINEEKTILFVGSGSSCRLGYPSWSSLLVKLNNKVDDPIKKAIITNKIENGDLILAAEIIKRTIGEEEYFSVIKNTFKPNPIPYDGFHAFLVKRKFKGFVTTNYDSIFEDALRSIQNIEATDYGITISESNKSKVHGFINNINSDYDSTERYHLYLHGKFDDSSSIILSYGEYIKKYDGYVIDKKYPEDYKKLIEGNINISEFESSTQLKNLPYRTLHYKTIYTLFLTQKIVFFGFGLKDEFLNRLIDDLQSDFEPAYRPNHFVLISENDISGWTTETYLHTKEQWRRKGINIVIFEDDDDYSGIESFLKDLSPISPLSKITEPKESGDKKITAKIMELSLKTAKELINR